ncbi:hypothetical protein [Nostoc sp.]|uniref:hypothetical protein n=1 Tax=Nostoc sp. TaxID=1180 RepID=UPI002FF9C220
MESQNTQQLTDDIQNKSSKALNNSEVGVASENNTISEDNSLDLQSSIDPNQIKNNAGKDQQAQDLSQVMPGKRNLLVKCWSEQLQDWVRCP